MNFPEYDFDQAMHNPQYPLHAPDMVLCNGWIIPHPTPFADIMRFYRAQMAAHPQYKLLLLLDDIDQALYTCGHCCDTYNLNDTEGFDDLPNLSPYAFDENGERHYSANTVAEFPIRHTRFMRELNAQFPIADYAHLQQGENFQDVDWEAEDWVAFIKLMREPDLSLSWVLGEHYLCRVPVAHSWEVITALPNGYFGGDLNPFEIAVFAQIIEKQFSYQLFGIGADLLGFVRLGEINREQAAAFADFLMHTFEIDLASADDEDDDKPINWRAYFAPQIIDCLLNQDVVFISYSENDFENWREDLDLSEIPAT